MAGLDDLIRVDGSAIPAGQGEIRAFLVVRNEVSRLPDVLRHHRTLGVDRFFVIDNGSSDGTLELLAAEPDTHVFRTDGSYAASRYGLDWCNALLEANGSGRWCLSIDADELFLFPRFEELSLRLLCDRLDGESAEAMFALMLDMYADAPIAETRLEAGACLLETCPYFDAGPYHTARTELFPHVQVYGGPRERLFRQFGIEGFHPPTISKVPLVKWRPGMRYLLGAHALTPARLSAMTGVLAHFKFLADFPGRVALEAARGEHFAGAREYRAYAEIITREPGLRLRGDKSLRWNGSRQLAEMTLMASAPDWDARLAS